MILLVVNVAFLAFFIGLIQSNFGSGFGISGVMNKAITTGFIYPIVWFITNIVLCFSLYEFNVYYLSILMPLAIPCWVLFRESSDEKRYSKVYLKHAPIIEKVIDETLKNHQVFDPQHANISFSGKSDVKVESSHLQIDVRLHTQNVSSEQKEAIKLELDQKLYAIYHSNSLIAVL